MRILFIPYHSGAISHGIPLLALNGMLNVRWAESAFLFPAKAHKAARQMGVKVLDIDHNGFRSEMKAYAQFRPHVVIDDSSLTTGMATALTGLPRITIQRTGLFPGTAPKRSGHRHSLGLDVKQAPDITALGLEQPQNLPDLFKAPVKIVPGIRSLEVLPYELQDDPSYYFSGPLITDDYLVNKSERTPERENDLSNCTELDLLSAYFDNQSNRKRVYVTFGTVAHAYKEIFECIRYLLNEGIAVVSSVKLEGLTPGEKELYCYVNYLPMHYVCSKVDLMVHQCGSGTYHYPILHNVPTITMGTKCYDREDVALRLEELGASVHIASPDETEDFAGKFRGAIEKYFDHSGEFIREKKKNIARLWEEIEQTQAAFNIEAALKRAISSCKNIKSGAKTLGSNSQTHARQAHYIVGNR
jgi:hypothetical protein